VITGLILRGTSAVTSPIHLFAAWAPLLGGLSMVRWIHHIVMWLLLGFTVHHVYSAILVAMVEKNGTIDSIISGWKWVPRRDLAAGPYRWSNRGQIDE
jgi:Ni/Fe-hydrogenase 1 B-type cytochrome subunit